MKIHQIDPDDLGILVEDEPLVQSVVELQPPIDKTVYEWNVSCYICGLWFKEIQSESPKKPYICHSCNKTYMAIKR